MTKVLNCVILVSVISSDICHMTVEIELIADLFS